jgi:predicted ArsR family transcriptional regulator
MTSEAARQQFVKLANAGLVEAYSQTRGVGRPVQLWQLTSKGHGRFPDTHADLTVQLLDAVRETFGPAAIDQLITVREQQSLQAYTQALSPAQSLQERVQRLADVRTREGYMAEYEAVEGGYLLIENHCPICAAASSCQNFCRSEQQLFEQVLQAKVTRVEHLLSNSRRCVYQISP